MERKIAVVAVFVLLILQACSGGGNGSGFLTPTGAVDVSLTDGPGEYDHVYITVRDIWFHQDADAGPAMAGWLRYPLAAPVTIDLLSLSNGVVGSPVWKDLELPSGDYRQIRLVLAGTEDDLTASAGDLVLQFNNEVVIGSSEFPLRVPSARLGIMLTGDFRVNPAGKLKLAVDFDAGHDIVDVQRDGNTEYILKPRLAHFDLDDAGAVVGSIDLASAATNSTSRFVIKAEQVNDALNPQYRVVRRWTIVNRVNGNFVLYPLRPGTYDIVIRGLDHETVIVRNVPVAKGTTPASGATSLPRITIPGGSDYAVAGSITFPTGAWTDLYQTLQADPVPYEVRFRHFNPLTGKFPAFKLSDGPLHVADFISDNTISGLTPTTPAEGIGAFRAAAAAMLFSRATYTADGTDVVSSATTTVSFGSLVPKTPPSVPGGRSISGMITRPTGSMGSSLNEGVLFVGQGGMIVHTLSLHDQMQMMSAQTYTVSGLPGGSMANPLPFAFYGVDALAWQAGTPAKAVAIPAVADVRTNDDDGVDMHMIMLP